MAIPSIGLSGLAVSQRLLDLTGQNIANANTPGFHRQVASLAMRTAGEGIGAGVEITQVRRLINHVLESSITRNAFEFHNVSTQLDGMRQIETMLQIGEGSVHNLLEKFFNEMEQVAGQPADMTQRRAFLATAAALTEAINAQNDELDRIREGMDRHIAQVVDEVNRLAAQIADHNAIIHRVTIEGTDANDLMDQRDQFISQLAELVDVKTVPQEYGQVNVIAGSVPVVLNHGSIPWRFVVDEKRQATVTPTDLPISLEVTGGRLGGLLEIRNRVLSEVQNRLDALSHELIRNSDTIHATGIGLDGPHTLLYGSRALQQIGVPLGQAGLAFPPEAGSLFISVTELATGERTLHEVTIDPATQSLQDVATAINAIANVQAVVDTQNRTLTLVARPGYAFDFAGRMPTGPTTQAITGTARPAIGGNYTGNANDTYTYRLAGTGTIGVTAGLTLEARNSAGDLLGSWNIGSGYEPGTEIAALNGVRVRMSSGTVNDGDTFSIRVVGEADTAGLLTALGLNTFFVGDNAATLAVRPDLVRRPELLAASRSGQPGDGANLRRWAALRDTPLLAEGTESLRKFYASLAADIGGRVQDLDERQTVQDTVRQRLEAERQSISGVDPNEELVRLVQFQRAFQFSARYLTVMNETLDDLLNLVS